MSLASRRDLAQYGEHILEEDSTQNACKANVKEAKSRAIRKEPNEAQVDGQKEEKAASDSHRRLDQIEKPPIQVVRWLLFCAPPTSQMNLNIARPAPPTNPAVADQSSTVNYFGV